MELRQLEYLVAVAEEANFTRAAQRVHISQSGVSAQIRQLENELGSTLIDRTNRHAGLTPAGTAALEHARTALNAIDALRRGVDEVNGLIRGQLAVGMVSGCTITALFDTLAAFHHAHPGIEVTLLEDSSDRLIQRVRNGEIDLALVGTAGVPEDLDILTVLSERLAAAVAFDHPLASHRRVTLATLTAYPLVTLPEGTGVRAVLDRACAAASVRAHIAMQASAPATIADLAARGLGVAILSESMIALHRDRLHTLTIDDAHIPAVLALAWRANHAPALQEFVRHSKRIFRPETDETTTSSADTRLT